MMIVIIIIIIIIIIIFFLSNFLLSIDCAKFCNSLLVYFVVILQTGKIPTWCWVSTSKYFTFYVFFLVMNLCILCFVCLLWPQARTWIKRIISIWTYSLIDSPGTCQLSPLLSARLHYFQFVRILRSTVSVSSWDYYYRPYLLSVHWL